MEWRVAGLWMKSVVAEEVWNKVYDEIFCENTKNRREIFAK
jgi:hypothetical protein